ncbi:MAG: transglutaminase domain-containing protein [Kiritimatiellae bacterium]|nr:transglutaminase domain-containing protein [Kiritimatiellia bacterium]
MKNFQIVFFFISFSAFATLERDVDFLLRYAPSQDMPLPGGFVTNNCLLAARARDTAPEAYADEIYLDYVLPYSVIREERDDWRAEFRERFAPIVAGCTNAYEAAVKLDRSIWDLVGVHYDTRRDKARQSPRHSMRIGMASCTGISIILIDACRALGIPARLVGCNWTTIPGNHSWVEVWSQGRWRVLASGEKEREDSIWFLDYAAMADSARIDKRIYASRYSPSPEGTRFWRTWDYPQDVSDVPADDVTAKYVIKPRYAIIASRETLADSEWRIAAEALAAKHDNEALCTVVAATATDALATLRGLKPRYVAFLMRPEEFCTATLLELKSMMREIDDDPFDDAIWGIVTGPDAKTVQRIASSRSPNEIGSILATTGVSANVVTGDVACISDAYPKGEWWRKSSTGLRWGGKCTNEVASVFSSAWRDIDPECLLTSSHATERNLEMPFSLGNLVATNGVFATTSKLGMAHDHTPIAGPLNEKVWLAAGNCLIANHIDSSDMLMTALSFGKVNQFAGYFKETWFGFVGWNTWTYFGAMGYSLSLSHYAANQWLLKKLALGEHSDENEFAGLVWDRDATIFYGDPMHAARIKPRADAQYDTLPQIVVFPDSTRSHKVTNVPEDFMAFCADDFAIIERKK